MTKMEIKDELKVECGLTEWDVERGWVCPFDNPNEPIECCEDCAFAKVAD